MQYVVFCKYPAVRSVTSVGVYSSREEAEAERRRYERENAGEETQVRCWVVPSLRGYRRT